MKIFADIDEAGKLRGFYPDDIWSEDRRPAAAVEIPEAIWRAWIINPTRRYINGELVDGPVEPPSEDDYANAIDEYLDQIARARDYRDAARLAGYAASTIPQYAADAMAFIAWRDAVWIYAYQMLGEVKSMQIVQPTIEAFIMSLPQPPWRLT